MACKALCVLVVLFFGMAVAADIQIVWDSYKTYQPLHVTPTDNLVFSWGSNPDFRTVHNLILVDQDGYYNCNTEVAASKTIFVAETASPFVFNINSNNVRQFTNGSTIFFICTTTGLLRSGASVPYRDGHCLTGQKIQVHIAIAPACTTTTPTTAAPTTVAPTTREIKIH
eukprot:TRINITY_DN293_c0_g1_i5.p1 TRINITY_DN293_c0_g1~~TRINITY_DN293_c0_g1_i5.p1  ORF type:complete len:170 (-),score=57.57 TRINITY_DN293_c0_g1_i5:151-660(-)